MADVIREVARIPESAAEDVRRVLAARHEAAGQGENCFGDNPFAFNADYVSSGVDGTDFEVDWLALERSLRKRTRYFNRDAEEILHRIFDGIEEYRTVNGRSIVVEAGPGTEIKELYRARLFQAERSIREAMKQPDKDVGPPPSSIAVSGRMNAAGIAVFYGATDAEVALAEVRPPVGSKVLIGCFNVVKSLRLLDLGALRFIADEQGSVFDAVHVHRLKQANFLREFNRRISKPVMPEDQILDYVPTQAIADFLANTASPPFDGIIYSSAQVPQIIRTSQPPGPLGIRNIVESCNVVLFHQAAAVETVPAGGDVVADHALNSALGNVAPLLLSSCKEPNLPDPSGFPDANVDYTVFEKAAIPIPEPHSASLELSSLHVYSVKAVKFDTESGSVIRVPYEPT